MSGNGTQRQPPRIPDQPWRPRPLPRMGERSRHNAFARLGWELSVDAVDVAQDAHLRDEDVHHAVDVYRRLLHQLVDEAIDFAIDWIALTGDQLP